MKKIGIITIHHNQNYGAVLQAYALQEKLEQLGYDSELINFIPTSSARSMRLFSTSLIENIRTVLFLKKRIIRRQRFVDFFKKKHKLSKEPIYDYNNLKEDAFDYDVYITGSDQTFNLLLRGMEQERKMYFLPFVKEHKKISYAPSMGERIAALDEQKILWIKNALSSYDSLLVREKAAADFIAGLNITPKAPEVVLDPTLLLDRSDYDKIEKRTKYEKGKYILFYSVLSDSWVVKKVQEIAKQLNLKVVAPHYKNRFEQTAGFVRAEECGPEEFISLVKNAAFVCTSSFHGTVFSLIYNKPFVSFLIGEGNRIGSLLDTVNMRSRAVRQNDDVDALKLLDIDYTEANKLLEDARERSKNLLIEAIGD